MYGIFRRGGAKSVADIDTGGSKALLFDIFTVLSLLFLLPGGKLHCQLRWGAMAGYAPSGSAPDHHQSFCCYSLYIPESVTIAAAINPIIHCDYMPNYHPIYQNALQL